MTENILFFSKNNNIFFKNPKKKTKGSLKGPKKQNIIEQNKGHKRVFQSLQKQ